MDFETRTHEVTVLNPGEADRGFSQGYEVMWAPLSPFLQSKLLDT
jgi:hypothetical protein